MKNFKKIDHNKLNKISGGIAASTMIVAGTVLTMLIKTLVSAVSSMKMMFSDKGSVKVDGYESHWENHKEPAKKSGSHYGGESTNYYNVY